MTEQSHPQESEADKAFQQAADISRSMIYPTEPKDVLIALTEQQHQLKLVSSRRERAETERNEALETATYDKLTGLPNRRWLEPKLEELVEGSPGNFALFMIDLNGLKATNDTQGHKAGDELIKHAAIVTQQTIRHEANLGQQVERRSGQHNKDLLVRATVRLAGDEFVVLLSDIHSEDQLRAVMERLHDSWYTNGISASMGGKIHTPGESAVDLLSKADELMYQMKQLNKTELEQKNRQEYAWIQDN
jgi:diguanylate cyclase (GGDEF)-like protein